jgi:alkaline phosphatase D
VPKVGDWVIDRRGFLAGVVATAVAGACSSDDEGDKKPRRRAEVELPPVPAGLPSDLFVLGVASGDPVADSVILWTRLVVDTVEPVPVGWEVASDEDFEDVVASGDVVAEAALGHAVHVDADGLEPDSWYWYRFTVGESTSPVGRARTTPDDDGDSERLRFAFASCQNRQNGLWTAYEHMVEEDVDLVFFLGDYIYEEGPRPDSLQPYTSAAPVDLATYRARWAEYKGDPLLQAMHARCPWVVTWDDHEVANDYAELTAQDADPADESAQVAFQDRRDAAYQAFYEHMPVRLEPPQGRDYRIHREVAWGTLAHFFVLDGRQYRSNQACDATRVIASAGPLCPEAEADDRTMLGDEQEAWLGEALSGSPARWNVLAQQTVVAAVPFADGLVNLDQWDGYPAARGRLLDQLEEARNPVILTGDIHLGAVGTVEREPGEPVAAELVGTSISSGFPLADLVEQLAGALPHVQYVNARQRGYVVCEVTPDELRAEYRVVSDVAAPAGTIATDSTWTITDGDPVPRAG